MEDLMIKAIKQFKKEHKNVEIQACYVTYCTSLFGEVVFATFCIKYALSVLGKVKKEYIYVEK